MAIYINLLEKIAYSKKLDMSHLVFRVKFEDKHIVNFSAFNYFNNNPARSYSEYHDKEKSESVHRAH